MPRRGESRQHELVLGAGGLVTVAEKLAEPEPLGVGDSSVIVRASTFDVFRSVFRGSRGSGFQLKNGVRPFIEPVCGNR